MSEQVTKTITITRLHDSDHMARLEAGQLEQDAGALNKLTPSPRTWNLTATVIKAAAHETGSVQTKPSVEFTVEVTGEQRNIDGWEEEYRRVHTLMPTRTDSMQELDKAREAAQAKKDEAAP